MKKPFNNQNIPAIGFGTYPLLGEDCYKGVKDAIEIGYLHIDTASKYNNEAAVGKAIYEAGIRNKLFVTTKVWYTDLSPKGIVKSTEKSLQNLQMEYVDLLLIHWPTKNMDLRRTLDVFFKIKEAGKTKNIGVSNFPPSLFKKACEAGPIFTNQVEYHPYLSHKGLLSICEDNSACLTAYSPLAQGKIKNEPLLQSIGEKYNKTPAQVALRWLIQQTLVVAIPQSSTHEHRLLNFNIFDFELSSDEMDAIHQLQRGERLCNPYWSPHWEDEH